MLIVILVTRSMAIASTIQAAPGGMVVRAFAVSSNTLSSVDFTVLIGLPPGGSNGQGGGVPNG